MRRTSARCLRAFCRSGDDPTTGKGQQLPDQTRRRLLIVFPKRLRTLGLTLTLAGCFAASTCFTSASASTYLHSSHNVAAGGGSSAAGGPVQLTGYSNNDGTDLAAILTGTIGDHGKAIRTDAAGRGSARQFARLEIVTSRGSFKLEVTDLAKSLLRGFSQFPTDTSTCSGEVMVSGNSPIVTGSGTGDYRGISGTFQLTITIDEVDPWPHCSSTSPHLAQIVYLRGTGSVTFRA